MSSHDLSSGGRLEAHPQPVSLTSVAFRRWLGLGVLLIGSFVTSLDSAGPPVHVQAHAASGIVV